MIVCLDLEGVLVPEVWINFAEKTSIEALRATTRDIPDYNVLMKQRLKILEENKLKLSDIQEVIAKITPLEGAVDFINWLKERVQVVILSDTFDEFAKPLMRQLGWPTILCHKLDVDENGWIKNYVLRRQDQKRLAVEAFKGLNQQVIAAGDSYNDISMLKAADRGILFHSPDNIVAEFPQFPAVFDYETLKGKIVEYAAELGLKLEA